MGKRSLAKPGSMPVVKQVAPPSAQASVIGSIHEGGFCFMCGQTHGVMAVERHVDAGTEEGAHVADVGVGLAGGGPVVHQGVGAEGDERIEVVGGSDPGRSDAADLPDVAADLVLVADADPDQLEVRVPQHLGDHHLPHEPRSPDDDPLALAHGGIIAPGSARRPSNDQCSRLETTLMTSAMITAPYRNERSACARATRRMRLGREVRVRDLKGHADGQRQVGEVEIGGRIVFVEVDPADRPAVVGAGIAQREHGVDQRPGQGDAHHAEHDEEGLRPPGGLAGPYEDQPDRRPAAPHPR